MKVKIINYLKDCKNLHLVFIPTIALFTGKEVFRKIDEKTLIRHSGTYKNIHIIFLWWEIIINLKDVI